MVDPVLVGLPKGWTAKDIWQWHVERLCLVPSLNFEHARQPGWGGLRTPEPQPRPPLDLEEENTEARLSASQSMPSCPGGQRLDQLEGSASSKLPPAWVNPQDRDAEIRLITLTNRDLRRRHSVIAGDGRTTVPWQSPPEANRLHPAPRPWQTRPGGGPMPAAHQNKPSSSPHLSTLPCPIRQPIEPGPSTLASPMPSASPSSEPHLIPSLSPTQTSSRPGSDTGSGAHKPSSGTPAPQSGSRPGTAVSRSAAPSVRQSSSRPSTAAERSASHSSSKSVRGGSSLGGSLAREETYAMAFFRTCGCMRTFGIGPCSGGSARHGLDSTGGIP